MHTDACDLPQSSTTDHPIDHALEAYCPHCAHEVDAICPECRSMVEPNGADDVMAPISAGEFHRRLLNYLYSKRNSKFAIACFFIATGQAEADGISMTEFAVHFGVTKATVSKYCREICAYFGIQPSRYMRSEENAQKFKLSNRRPMNTNGNRGN